MLTVLDLCPYWSYPPAGGGPLRVFNLNKEAAKFARILQFSCRPTFGHLYSGWKGWLGSRSQHITSTYYEYQYFSPLILGVGYILYKLGFHSDLFISELVSALSPRELRNNLSESSIIQVEHPWLFKLAKGLAGGRPIIYIAHNFEAELWRNPSWSKKLVREARLLEVDAVRSSTAVVAMSDMDAWRLTDEYGIERAKIAIIPNGVNLKELAPAGAEQKLAARRKLGLDKRPVLLFLGSDHYPNREAVSLIRKWQSELGPRLNVQFLVVGTVGRYFQTTPFMRVEGFVKDVREYLLAADIGLNPSLSGSGVSLKTSEYLAWGLPLISTPVGVRGLELEGANVMIGGVADFPWMIETLVTNRQSWEKHSREGRQVVEKYDWERLGERMVEVYRRVMP